MRRCLFALLLVSGCGPLHEVHTLLQTEAGQKLVDKLEIRGDVDLTDPAVEVYMLTGFGLRASGTHYRAQAATKGEVSDDERGFASETVPPPDPDTTVE